MIHYSTVFKLMGLASLVTAALINAFGPYAAVFGIALMFVGLLCEPKGTNR